MGVDINIEREPPLTQTEWIEAVTSLIGLRLDDSDISGSNPFSETTIHIRGKNTDVSVYFTETKSWEKAIYFYRDFGSFSYTRDWDNESSSIRKAAVALAKKLNAKLTVDGEDLGLP